MATTEDIAITSNALILIGDQPISSWDETAGGIASKALYQKTVDSMLMDFPWTFALDDAVLTAESASPNQLWQYNNQFVLPPASLRLWRIMPNNNYDIVGNLLLSNYTEMLAVFTKSVDSQLFSGKFSEALEYRLAMKFGLTITEDSSIMKEMKEEYKNLLAMAKHIDSTQKPQQEMFSKPFSQARLGGMGYGGFLSEEFE
jgi:hypothetical protein